MNVYFELDILNWTKINMELINNLDGLSQIDNLRDYMSRVKYHAVLMHRNALSYFCINQYYESDNGVEIKSNPSV